MRENGIKRGEEEGKRLEAVATERRGGGGDGVEGKWSELPKGIERERESEVWMVWVTKPWDQRKAEGTGFNVD